MSQLLTTPAWHERANCQGTDPDEFYPDKGGRSDLAKYICSRCPVRTDCLQDALARDERHGIWGGLSDVERLELKKRRARGADITPIRKRNRGGLADHHTTIVELLDAGKTWPQIGDHLGYTAGALKAYWKRQKQAAEQQAVAA